MKCKLTASQVTDIRHRWTTTQDSMAAIARDYAVSDMTIYKVVMNITYKYLPHAVERQAYAPDHSKLTVDDVKVIRRACRIGKASLAQIGRDFGVSPTQVRRVESGENWRHVK